MSVRIFAHGGGVQSTAALVLAAQGKIPFRNFIFVNVGEGAESPATLRYMREVLQPWADEQPVGLVEVAQYRERIRAKGQYRGEPIDLYEYLADPNLKGVPIPMRMPTDKYDGRWVFGNRGCTDRWKRQVLAKIVAPYAQTEQAVIGLGISLDELGRMRTDSGFAYIRNEYPLIDLRLTRQDCVEIIRAAGLPPAPKSSCWFCPFHSAAYWRALRLADPELWDKGRALQDTLNRKRAAYGRDAAWLCQADTFTVAPRDDDAALTPDEVCESGYCMV